MGKYFSNFPVSIYANTVCIDITTSTHLTKQAMRSASLYYNAQVPDQTRPDVIGDKYYKSSFYDWLVYYSNDITDPYYDWPLSNATFDAYIIDKYGSIAKSVETVLHYKVNWKTDDSRLTPAQYQSLNSAQRKYWQPSTDDTIAYVRKGMDHKVNTNAIVDVDVDDTAIFTTGDYVNQITDGVVTASGEVSFVGDNYILVRHLEGAFDAGNIFNVFKDTSTTVPSTYTGGTIQYVIPQDELVYWEKVCAYDYEMELNEDKRQIRLLNKKYVRMIEEEHYDKININNG